MSRQTRKRTGLILIATGTLLPLVTYFIAQQAMQSLSLIDSVPDQGAMVTAYLAWMGSIAAGVILMICGLCFIMRGMMVRE